MSRMPKRTRRSGLTTWVSGAFFAVAIIATIVGYFVPGDGSSTVAAAFAPLSPEHLLGSDGLGRDVLMRLLHGGAQLLAVAALSTAVASFVGVVLGFAVSGGSKAAKVLSYALDMLLVVPSMLVIMVLVFGLGSGIATMVAVTTAVSAPYIARYTRSLVRPLAGAPYVSIARLAGDPPLVVAAREILPNMVLPIATTVGLRFINAIYLVASAAFLGFDPLGTGADWGTMIQTGVSGIALNPWAALAPTIAIASITISGNLLLDRLGDRSMA